MRVTVTRQIQFSAGHRLWKHEGRCASLHGHNYRAIFHAQADQLDAVGRVVDFAVLKQRLGGWLEEHWDHAFICHKDDHETVQAVSSIPDQRLFLLDSNPTAENLATYLLKVAGPQQLAGTGIRLVKVELWETENCCAEVAM